MLLLFFITSTISQGELSITLQKQYAHPLNDNDMNLPYKHLNDLIINLFIYLFIETYLYRIKQSAEVFSSVVLWYMKRYTTRMWNMISLPATPTVCLEQKSENLQSRNVILSMPSPSQK